MEIFSQLINGRAGGSKRGEASEGMHRDTAGSSVFTAIADPTRRAMMDFLMGRPRTAGEIVSHFPQLSQPGVSQHLRVLREAQLVNVTVQAQQRIYSLKPQGLRTLHDWISKYQLFWTDKLEALEEHLDAKSKLANKESTKKK
jgi:DNA-binding transcriptional ArsR family regulator